MNNISLRFLFGFLLITNLVYAQKISVIDAKDNKPIIDVFIYDSLQNNTLSDINGEIDASIFENGMLYFQHPSYHTSGVRYNNTPLVVRLTEKISHIKEVIVVGSKWQQDLNDVSQRVAIVKKSFIEFSNPQTSADLLEATGEVFVQKSQLGGGSPKLRGFAANSVLLVVDGTRINNAIFRGGNLQNVINIDANALESVEILYGPNSIVYGSDAMGGVMYFHTRNPQLATDSSKSFFGTSMLRFSSSSVEKTGHFDLNYSKKKFALYSSTSLSSLGNLTAGNLNKPEYFSVQNVYVTSDPVTIDTLAINDNSNVQLFSNYTLFNHITKIKYKPHANLSLQNSFYFSTTTDIPRYDRLTEPTERGSNIPKFAKWYYGPQKWLMNQLKVSYEKPTFFFDKALVTLAFQRFHESRHDRRYQSEYLRNRFEKVDLDIQAIDFEKKIKKFSTLSYGFERNFNNVTSHAYGSNSVNDRIPESPRYPQGGSQLSSEAAYLNVLLNQQSRVRFHAGIRISHFNLKVASLPLLIAAIPSDALPTVRILIPDTDDYSLENVAFTGMIGITFEPWDNHLFNVSLSEGFRAPNVDDIAKLFEVGEALTLPNFGLQPETSLNHEISYIKHGNATSFKFSTFYTLVDGLIAEALLIADGYTFITKKNLESAKIFGFNFNLSHNWNQNWESNATLSYNDGEETFSSQPLRHTVPLFGRLGTRFQRGKFKSDLYIRFNGQKKIQDIPISEIVNKYYLYASTGSPAWYTLNLKTQYQINPKFNINVGLENIFNTHYRTYTSGISAPGRNLIITLRAKF